MAFILALTGTLALYGVWVATHPQGHPRIDLCRAPSPDGAYSCTDTLGHNGWCRNGEIEWRWDAWAIGCDDDTRRAHAPVEPTEVIIQRRRIPRWLFWPALAMVFWVLAFATEGPADHKTTNKCAWNGYNCTWEGQ